MNVPNPYINTSFFVDCLFTPVDVHIKTASSSFQYLLALSFLQFLLPSLILANR